MEVNLIDALQQDTSMLTMTGAEVLYQNGFTGQGVTVAVIDTGLARHDALPVSRIVGGKNFTNEGTQEDYTDRHGHGTHVAGIIAAEQNQYFRGMAPKANLLILKAMDSGGKGETQGIINAIQYAISQKVDIINMSLGYALAEETLHEAVKLAVANNICVCCAAGNSGDGREQTDEWNYPGSYEEVICVGAMSNDYGVSRFSNSNRFVDLIAPGENILSTYLGNGFVRMTGTSMATPVVSGGLALLIEYGRKEFGRRLLESELYGLLIKCTKSLNVPRDLQGNGYLYLTEYKK